MNSVKLCVLGAVAIKKKIKVIHHRDTEFWSSTENGILNKPQ